MTEGMTIDEMRDASVYMLSDMASCTTPDSKDSPGARMLACVRDAVVEAIESGRVKLADFNDNGQLSEIADDAPSVYTHTRWQQFVDLGAYDEEPEVTDEWGSNLTEAAGMALYQIADRLAHALAEAWRAGWECPTCGDCGEPLVCDEDTCYAEPDDTADTDGPVKAPEVPAEPLPIRTPGLALVEAKAADMAVLTGPVDLPVSDPILSLIDRAEATDMGVRVSRAAMAHDRAVSRVRRTVWTVAGILATVSVPVIMWIGGVL